MSVSQLRYFTVDPNLVMIAVKRKHKDAKRSPNTSTFRHGNRSNPPKNLLLLLNLRSRNSLSLCHRIRKGSS